MGFWSALGSVLKPIAQAASDLNQKAKAREPELASCSDEQLISMYQTSSLVDRIAAGNVFKHRHGFPISRVLRKGKK